MTVSTLRPGSGPVNLTLLISTVAIMLDIASASELPHVRIRASEPGPLIDIPELLRFRDLLWTLAERDLKVRYKQTALGVIWVVLQPLMSSLIFAFVFGVIAGMPSDGKPYLVFAFAGMTAWNTFANVLTKVSASLLGNGQMISKIYFPRLIVSAVSFSHFDRIWESEAPAEPLHFPQITDWLGRSLALPRKRNGPGLIVPLSSVVSALVDSAFSLVLLFVMMAIYRVWPDGVSCSCRSGC